MASVIDLSEEQRLQQSFQERQATLDAYLSQPRLFFGKYKGKTYAAIAKKNKRYANWFIQTVTDKCAVERMRAALAEALADA